ncbi:MFS transporter [Corynebacterium sp. CCM 8835]|uniref:Multidrug efflux pump Tap n=1 Tax=Corynebacterium antarcticum TaxID=2800405 RepID=A0ABS1FLW2_9CORY|nr:MFS transporter [Corynebacterium antarcticum]MCK7643031.1 MFS transporter [Corynebacterium antarcticum]MCK7661534.1 MFS transporter [Corynebacterium antarcticum]MCL0246277.1 MFS transporter [Corynebacterium antarcticum]MCX7493018.1 MFS transporter [Corynebacterium antarcticum]
MTTGTPARHRASAWLYLSSAGLSQFGNSIALIAWPWLILERTGNPAAAGTVVAVTAVAGLIVSFIGGQLIDTLGRKPMSVISDVISGLSIVALIAVDASLELTLAWFIGLAVFGAVGDVPGMAARQSLLGDVSATSGVSRDRLAGIMQTLVGVAALIGPALGGVLMAVQPVITVLWITAGCSLVAAALTTTVRVAHTGGYAGDTDPDVPDMSVVRQWRDILTHPIVRLLLIMGLVSTMLVVPYLVILLPAHYQSVDSPAVMGAVLATYAVGFVIGGGLATVLGTRRRRTLWGTTVGLFTLAFLFLGGLGNDPFVFTGMVLAGIGAGLFGPLHLVLITETVPDRVRGRTLSLFTAAGSLSQSIGLTAAAPLIAAFGVYRTALGIGLSFLPFGVWSGICGVRTVPPAQPETNPGPGPGNDRGAATVEDAEQL